MKANIGRSASLIPFAVLVAAPAMAQDLTLFQEDGSNPRGGFAQLPPQAVAVQAAPEVPSMMLKGIYRFGDEYHVSLQSSEGGTYNVTWQEGQTSPVAVATGFELQGVDNRTVMLGLPSGVSCQQSAQSGSNCIGRNQVALSFAQSEPVRTRTSNRDFRGGTVTFSTDNNDRRGRTDDIRQLFEAMNGGDTNARAAIEQLIQARGQGGDRNQGGGRGNRGGGGGAAGGGGGGGFTTGGDNVTFGGRGGRGGNGQ